MMGLLRSLLLVLLGALLMAALGFYLVYSFGKKLDLNKEVVPILIHESLNSLTEKTKPVEEHPKTHAIKEPAAEKPATELTQAHPKKIKVKLSLDEEKTKAWLKKHKSLAEALDQYLQKQPKEHDTPHHT